MARGRSPVFPPPPPLYDRPLRPRVPSPIRWIGDLSLAVSKAIDSDVSLIRDQWCRQRMPATDAASGELSGCLESSGRESVAHALAPIEGSDGDTTRARYQGWLQQAKDERPRGLVEAAEAEGRAARLRASRIEAAAALAREGLAAHWREFWREQAERERLAGAARDMVTARWEERQQRMAQEFWNAWKNRVTTASRMATEGRGISDGVEPSALKGTTTSPSPVSQDPSIQEVEGRPPSTVRGPTRFVDGIGHGAARHFWTLPDLPEEDETRRSSADPSRREARSGSDGDSARHREVEIDEEAEWLETLRGAICGTDLVDLGTLGATVGARPGGVAVLCLAHDAIIEEGESGGLVRCRPLLAATEAFVASRRKMRALIRRALAEGSEPDGRGDTSGVPGGGTGDSLARLLRVEPAEFSAVASAEAALELGVIGDDLSLELTRIFGRRAESLDERIARASSIRRALRNHRVFLSPQCVCALAALLSAGGETPHSEGVGAAGDGPSPAPRSIQGWRSSIESALVAVRRASLEHALMWAASCDVERVASTVGEACGDRRGNRRSEWGAAGGGAERDASSIEALWSAMHGVSGLGLSPLFLLAITSPQGNASPGGRAGDKGERGEGVWYGGAACRSVVRSLMILLSPGSLREASRRLRVRHASGAIPSEWDRGVVRAREGLGQAWAARSEASSDAPGNPDAAERWGVASECGSAGAASETKMPPDGCDGSDATPGILDETAGALPESTGPRGTFRLAGNGGRRLSGA